SGAFVSIDGAPGFPSTQIIKDPGGLWSVAGLPWNKLSAGVGSVDFFVLHLGQFNGLCSPFEVWLNPPAGLGPPDFVVCIPSPYSLDRFYYRSDPQQELDEIRVGTNPGDVAAGQSPPCPGDVNGDGMVDLTDLAILLAHFGVPAGASHSDGDLTGDGSVSLDDLAIVLSRFGRPCP